jgi:hypothetical protein
VRGRGRTRRVTGGKKAGVCISSIPWYFFARAVSKLPYLALAGSVQGGTFPEPWFTPPRKMGMKLGGVRIEMNTADDGDSLDGDIVRCKCIAVFEEVLGS